MKKYWQIYKINISRVLTYRAPLVIYRLSNLLIIIVIAYVWLSSSHNGLIGGFTISELLTYYIAGMILTPLVMWTADHKVSAEINSGELALNYLLKPVSYFWSKFFSEAGWHTISPIFVVISLPFVLMLFGRYLSLNINFALFILCLMSSLLAASMFFCLTYLIGLLSFWFTDIDGFSDIFWMALFLFGGQGIPISFYPKLFNEILLYLPFRFLFSFPLEIFSGKLDLPLVIKGFGVGIFWVIIFGYLAKIVLNKGLKGYSSFGN